MPQDGQVFTAPATINLQATATDAYGIANVKFFNGATQLAQENVSPYTFSWTNVAAGTYTLTARATNSGGQFSTDQVIVTVNPVAAPVSTTIQVTSLTVTTYMYVKVSTNTAKTLRVRIYSSKGKLVRDNSYPVASGSSTVNVPTRGLYPGTYKSVINFPDKQVTVYVKR
jgi:hypothetical protein